MIKNRKTNRQSLSNVLCNPSDHSRNISINNTSKNIVSCKTGLNCVNRDINSDSSNKYSELHILSNLNKSKECDDSPILKSLKNERNEIDNYNSNNDKNNESNGIDKWDDWYLDCGFCIGNEHENKNTKLCDKLSVDSCRLLNNQDDHNGLTNINDNINNQNVNINNQDCGLKFSFNATIFNVSENENKINQVKTIIGDQ